LVGPHDHELLLSSEQNHVAANGPAEVALLQEALRELVEMGDLAVVLGGEFVDGQEALVSVEGKVAGVVVREVVGAVAVADDEELKQSSVFA
jgi:hypothetical protein